MTDSIAFKTSMRFAYGEPAKMAAGIVRIVAENPGPFTFKGTNTYIVGDRRLTVVDPGPDDARHRKAILAAAAGRPIDHIVVTHTHKDHVDGLASLVAATGARTVGYGRPPPAAGAAGTAPSPSGGEFTATFLPDLMLRHGERLECGDHGFLALHTPGHAPDHLCLSVETGRGPEALISGDHVMAWNTSVVSPPEGRMADYLSSLELLIGRPEAVHLPGHGGRVEEPQRLVKAYLLHRRWREQAILAAITSQAADASATIRTIVPVVYPELDARLLTAATLSVQAHVEHLMEKGLVSSPSPPASGAASWDRRLCLA
jgi:glyoxylase-like metal-dependent hydrolase (beta-lactamase superfamily II)